MFGFYVYELLVFAFVRYEYDAIKYRFIFEQSKRVRDREKKC